MGSRSQQSRIKPLRVRDFGPLGDQVVLFGGPYSNLAALEALSDVIGDRDAICTGDIVGYAAEPVETVNLMQEMAVHCIAGNCELQVAAGAMDCGCGYEAGSTCDRLSQGWYSYLSDTCDPNTIAWLSDQPEIGVFTQQSRRYGIIHGGATVINRFLWPDTDTGVFLEEIAALEQRVGRIDGVVAGHSGIAFHRFIEEYQWINAGVIGLPPHDGRPETRYAVLKAGDVIFERLSYDCARTRAAMEAAGLVQGYHATMTSGIWPSEDILPSSLRH